MQPSPCSARQLQKGPTVPLLSKQLAGMPEAGVLCLQVYTPDALQGLQQPGGGQAPLSALKGREEFHSTNPTLLVRLTTAPSLSPQEVGSGLRGFCLFVCLSLVLISLDKIHGWCLVPATDIFSWISLGSRSSGAFDIWLWGLTPSYRTSLLNNLLLHHIGIFCLFIYLLCHKLLKDIAYIVLIIVFVLLKIF